jgi:hypothetical protein
MGGIGEAMLMSAAIGGGSAALTGGDPLKGALLGGLTGGIGGAISPLLGSLGGEAATLAATQAAPAAATAATNMAPTVANAAAMNAMSPTVANAAAMNATTPFSITGNPAISPALTSSVPSTARLGTLGDMTFGALPPDSAGISGLLKQSMVPPAAPAIAPAGPQTFGEGMQKFINDPLQSIKDNPMTAASAALRGATGARKKLEAPDEYDGPLKRFKFNPESYRSAFYGAEGGIASLAGGGYDRMVGEQPMYQAMASGGISNLGSYSDGGRMLKGPGDGMSDSIPANISGKRPARLADGEFVVPADVVSHLGNGSTDAGAKQLYAMMSKIRQARTGRKAQGREINPRQYVPA